MQIIERGKKLLSLLVFWVVMLYGLVDRYHCVRETYCLHLHCETLKSHMRYFLLGNLCTPCGADVPVMPSFNEVYIIREDYLRFKVMLNSYGVVWCGVCIGNKSCSGKMFLCVCVCVFVCMFVCVWLISFVLCLRTHYLC